MIELKCKFRTKHDICNIKEIKLVNPEEECSGCEDREDNSEQKWGIKIPDEFYLCRVTLKDMLAAVKTKDANTALELLTEFMTRKDYKDCPDRIGNGACMADIVSCNVHRFANVTKEHIRGVREAREKKKKLPKKSVQPAYTGIRNDGKKKVFYGHGSKEF